MNHTAVQRDSGRKKQRPGRAADLIPLFQKPLTKVAEGLSRMTVKVAHAQCDLALMQAIDRSMTAREVSLMLCRISDPAHLGDNVVRRNPDCSCNGCLYEQ